MAPEETTLAALTVLAKWLKKHGVPVSIYVDRRTVYFTEAFVHEPERRDDPAVFAAFICVRGAVVVRKREVPIPAIF